MVRALFFILIVGALVLIVLSLIRRTPQARRASGDDTGEQRALPPPPSAASDRALSRATVREFLHELAFDAQLGVSVPAEHVKVVSAVIGTLQVAATSPRYAVRRPLLLPEIVRAVNDSDTTRRELARLIARDPALVGSLLRLANSPIYRRGSTPIENVERALTVLGTQGFRSLVAAALVQPVFRSSQPGAGKFPEIVWDSTQRAAAAAELYAAGVEVSDSFAAQLVALVMGLGAIVVYRVALDEYSLQRLEPDATTLASLLDAQTAEVARQIAASWDLSDRFVQALAEQKGDDNTQPDSSLGRSLRFGLTVGALAVLRANGRIDDDVGLATLVAAGGTGERFERLWGRLTAAPDTEPSRVASR